MNYNNLTKRELESLIDEAFEYVTRTTEAN